MPTAPVCDRVGVAWRRAWQPAAPVDATASSCPTRRTPTLGIEKGILIVPSRTHRHGQSHPPERRVDLPHHDDQPEADHQQTATAMSTMRQGTAILHQAKGLPHAPSPRSLAE